jgi:hypothetical protein
MGWIWAFTQFPYCCYMLHKFRERSFIGSHSLTLRHKIKNKYINFWGTQVNFVDPNKWRKFHNFSCHIDLNMLLDYYKLDWLKVADISNMYFLQFTDAVAIYATVWYGCSHLHQTIIFDGSLWRYVKMEHFRTTLLKSILGFFGVSGNWITLYLSITVCRCIVKSSPCYTIASASSLYITELCLWDKFKAKTITLQACFT